MLRVVGSPSTVFDCPAPRGPALFYSGLALFYSRLLGWKLNDERTDDTWVQINGPSGQTFEFQAVENYRPPQWPGQEHPQQMHIDMYVADLDEAEAEALTIGATKHQTQPGETFRVFLDPAAHPFCLCQARPQSPS